ENQKNALAALQSAFGTAQIFGGQAANLTGQAANLSLQRQSLEAKQNALEQIKKAKENSLITEEQAQDLTRDAFNSILGNSGSEISKATEDAANAKKKVDEQKISPITGKELEKAAVEKA